MRILNTTLLATVLTATLFGGAASAATLFQDNFDRRTDRNVGNSWAQDEARSTGVMTFKNVLYMRGNQSTGPDAAAASRAIDTQGYNSIVLNFDWTAHSPNESSDTLHVAWAPAKAPNISNPGAWTELGVFSSDRTRTFSETLTFTPEAGNSLFNILFWTDVSGGRSGGSEGFNVDNVVVTGERAQVSTVPLPAGLPLLLSAFAGLGLMRRNRKNAA